MDTVLVGITTAAAVLVMLYKFNVKRLMAYTGIIDIGASLGLFILFAGTATGSAASMIAGLTISIALIGMKKLHGTEKLTLRGWRETEKPMASKIKIADKAPKIPLHLMKTNEVYQLKSIRRR